MNKKNFSHLEVEWHPTKNLPLTFGSSLKSSGKYWWLGKCGHEWDAKLDHRRRGSGCPFCSGIKVLTGFNDLATKNPSLAAEWHPTKNGELNPENVIASGSTRRAWWLCENGHEWEAGIAYRVKKQKCSVCVRSRVFSDIQELANEYPTLAREWHPTKNIQAVSFEINMMSNVQLWWLGECGHEWKTSLSRRVRGQDCVLCENIQISLDNDALSNKYPILVREWHPTKNNGLIFNSTLKSRNRYWWLGECGHEWESLLKSRVEGSGCPVCSGHRIVKSLNDLATKNPMLAAEWHPTKNRFAPNEIAPNSARKAWWKCQKDHEWLAPVSRRNAGATCPYCARKRILPGYNDLATTHPELAAEWHPTKNRFSQSEIAGLNKVWWLCSKNHEWEAAPNDRKKGNNCPFCANKKILVGYNDLATTHPELAAEWHPTKNKPLTSEQVTVGVHKRVWWRCAKAHEWEVTVGSRATGNGCPKCSNNVSKAEEKIQECLSALGLRVESSNRQLLGGKKELDLWIPEKNVAIEFNGIHWHKEKYRGRDSHYNKWLDCKNKGIQLIQIWEDDWNLRSEIVRRGLAHKLGVSKTEPVSRDVQAISISEQQAEKFLKENHLQGFASGSYYLGVVASGDVEKLQAAMILNMEPNNEGKVLEILRYASIANVTNDFSQLLSYAINAYTPEVLTVIADHCEANEELYANNDFIAEKEFPPDYMYVVKNERKPRSEYAMERFRDDPALIWEDGLTEIELADLNGLNRIWDAGKTHYRLVL